MKEVTADTLLKLYDKGLQDWGSKSKEEYDSKSPKGWNKFGISGIGKCAAEITRDWLLRDKPKEQSLFSLANMFYGAETHLRVRDLIPELEGEETEVSKEIPVEYKGESFNIYLTGHIDNILDGVIVDIKKAERFSFSEMEREGLPDTYMDQMMGYMALSGMRLAIVLVVGTHGQRMAIEVKWSGEKWKALVDRLAMIAWHRKNNKIAAREYEPGIPPCSWCRHNQDCWTPAKLASAEKSKVLTKKDKGFKDLHTLTESYKLQKDYETRATQMKAKVTALAVSVLETNRAQRVTSDEGSVSWVSFQKNDIEVLDAETAIKKGLARRKESRIQYPRITPAKEES